jgi:hypothetical protein
MLFGLPRGLRRRPMAARLLAVIAGSNPAGGHGRFVFCECCVLSGRGLCDGPITRPEESYRMRSVQLCVISKTSTVRLPRPGLGCCARGEKNCLCHAIKENEIKGK